MDYRGVFYSTSGAEHQFKNFHVGLMVYEESSSSENEIVSNAYLTSDFPWHSWLSCCDSKILDGSALGNIRIHFLKEGDTYQSICQFYQCKGVIVLTENYKILPFNFWHHFNTDNFCKCAIFLVSLTQKDSFSSDKLMIKVSAPPNLRVPQIRIEKATMGVIAYSDEKQTGKLVTVKILQSTFLSFPRDFFLIEENISEDSAICDAMQFIAILTSASDLEQQLGQCASSKGFIGCVIANCKDNLDLSPDIERVLEQYNGTVLLLKETDGKVFTRIFGSLRGELSVQLTLKEGVFKTRHESGMSMIPFNVPQYSKQVTPVPMKCWMNCIEVQQLSQQPHIQPQLTVVAQVYKDRQSLNEALKSIPTNAAGNLLILKHKLSHDIEVSDTAIHSVPLFTIMKGNALAFCSLFEQNPNTAMNEGPIVYISPEYGTLMYNLMGEYKSLECTFHNNPVMSMEFGCCTISGSKNMDQPHACFIQAQEQDTFKDVVEKLPRQSLAKKNVVVLVVAQHRNKCIPKKEFWRQQHSNQFLPVIYMSKENGDYLQILLKRNPGLTFFCRLHQGSITVKDNKTVHGCRFTYRQFAQLPNKCPMMTPETTASDKAGYAIIRPIQSKSDSYMKIMEEFKGFKIGCFILVNIKGSNEFPANFFTQMTALDIPCLMISNSNGIALHDKFLPELQMAADSPGVFSRLWNWAKTKITGPEKEAKADYVESKFQEINDFATLFKAMNEEVFTNWESISDQQKVCAVLVKDLMKTKMQHLLLHLYALYSLRDVSQVVNERQSYLKCLVDIFCESNVTNIQQELEEVYSNEMRRSLSVKPKHFAEAAESVVTQCKSPIKRMYFVTLQIYLDKPSRGGAHWNCIYEKGAGKFDLNHQNIKLLKNCLILGKLIKLEVRIKFNPVDIAKLLSNEAEHVTMGNFFLLLKEMEDFLNDCIVDFLKQVRQNVKFETRGILAIDQGTKILEYIKTAYSPAHESRSFSLELEEWWIHLSMEYIDFCDCDGAVKCVNLILASVQRTVSDSVDKIKEKILTKLSADMKKKISIDNFLIIFQSVDFITLEVLLQYLNDIASQPRLQKMHCLPSILALCNNGLERFSDKGRVHNKISNLLSSILKTTLKDEAKFVIDILWNTDMPLFCSKTQPKDEAIEVFREACKTFLKTHQSELHSHIIGYISVFLSQDLDKKDTGPFRRTQLEAMVLMTVLTKEDARVWNPESKPIQKCFCLILERMALNMKKILDTKLDFPYTLYWRYLAKTIECLGTKGSKKSLWCEDFPNAFIEIARLFNALTSSHPTIADETSEHLSTLRRDNDVSVFLFWIGNCRNFLKEKKQAIERKEWNENDIKVFSPIWNTLAKIAQLLNVDFRPLNVEKCLQELRTSQEAIIRFLFRKQETHWVSLLSVADKYGVDTSEEVELLKAGIISDCSELREMAEGRNESTLDDLLKFINPKATLNDLKTALNLLQRNFKPLHKNMNVLLYFHSKGSFIFERALKSYLHSVSSDKNSFTLDEFGEALEMTSNFLSSIPSGDVTYSTLQKHFFDLERTKKRSELKVLKAFSYAGIDERQKEDAFTGLDNITELLHIVKEFPNLKEVLQRYNLENCLHDESFLELQDIVNRYDNEEAKDMLSSHEASDSLKYIQGIVPINTEVLELFKVVADSHEVAQFLQTIEDQGADRFTELYELITHYLQHEEYDEEVLNQLPTGRNHLKPFLDKFCTFSELIENIRDLGLPPNESFDALKTINKNVVLVEQWFSKAQSDTLDSVVQDLNQVISTGEFCIHQHGRKGVLILQFQSHRGEKSIKWSEEEINDFTRKLGLLGKYEGKKGDEESTLDDQEKQIVQFQTVFKTARKMLNAWNELSALRPYGDSTPIQFCCDISHSESEEMWLASKRKVQEWKEFLSDIRKKYDKLLLVMIPKVYQIFSSLRESQQHQADLLLPEILYLFSPITCSGTELMSKIKDYILQISPEVCDLSGTEEALPFVRVGHFLNSMMTCEKLQGDSVFLPVSDTAAEGVLNSVVHMLPDQEQRSKLAIIYEIYKQRLPKAFEVYRCSKESTEEEIGVFFERVSFFSGTNTTFTIMDTHLLPLRLQEFTAKCYKKAIQPGKEFNLNFVSSGASLIQDLPYVGVKKYSRISEDDWKGYMGKIKKVLNAHFKGVHLVYGKAGNGKTHYILKQMDRVPQNRRVIISIDESFTEQQAIGKLRELTYAPENVIFFNFTMLPPNEKSSQIEKHAYAKLKTRLQWFLVELLIFGYVEDGQTGLSFSLPSKLEWTVFVEVPTIEFKCADEGNAYELLDDPENDPEKSLQAFFKDFPVLHLLGEPKLIPTTMPIDIENNPDGEDIQLVCKYLQAYEAKNDKRLGVDRPFNGHRDEQLGFKKYPDLSKRECRRILSKYMPKTAKINKMNAVVFIKYMARRCYFLEKCPAYNFNQCKIFEVTLEYGEVVQFDTSELGSFLIETMLKEVSDFLSPRRRSGEEGDPRKQLIYTVDEDGGGAFQLMALKAEMISPEEESKLKKLQIPIHGRQHLSDRDNLDSYLASAFGITTVKTTVNGKVKKRLKAIDDKKYVLTLDFALKMLEVNERYWANLPVIIEGETGVGKTFLVEMMSDLWNQSLLERWKRIKYRLWSSIDEICQELKNMHINDAQLRDILPIIQKSAAIEMDKEFKQEDTDSEVLSLDSSSVNQGNEQAVSDEHFNVICEKALMSGGGVCQLLDKLINRVEDILEREPLLPLLFEATSDDTGQNVYLEEFYRFLSSGGNDSVLLARALLKLLMEAKPRIYFKLNIHGALTAEGLKSFFNPKVKQAVEIMKRHKRVDGDNFSRCPKIIIFLDEINTASCSGLIKEILVEKRFHGEVLPRNIFIVGACNPHRSHSVVMQEDASAADKWEWVKGSYYVHKLHPSLRSLLWNYGALDHRQEKNYIEAKMEMIAIEHGSKTKGTHLDVLSQKIAESQGIIREFAAKHYDNTGMFSKSEAVLLSRSCVSQRDIQRVFTFYTWLLKTYQKFRANKLTSHKCFNEEGDIEQQRAVLVALGLTYYFRLNSSYRKDYVKRLEQTYGDLEFEQTLQEEMDFYMNEIRLPPGIAKTKALKENLFCIVACCCTKLPLIIVGEPGSSKTLSFNLAAANFKGADSKIEMFRNTEVFPCFNPHYYQCSRRTTSSEVETVFKRAIGRQQARNKLSKNNISIVFMDEAGLPEESMESLKVLHKYLDDAEVAFIGITNHILDAAKTNRAVTLCRPRADEEDIYQLASGCYGIASAIGSKVDSSDEYSDSDEEESSGSITSVIRQLCYSYKDLMEARDKKFHEFFGLRDFIHFINHMRRQCKDNLQLLTRINVRISKVQRALERNFNGHSDFPEILSCFLASGSDDDDYKEYLNTRSIVEILQESLDDKPRFIGEEDFEEIRYKLIIDATEDDSSRRLLVMFGIIDPANTKTVVGSDFPDDGDLQKIITIAEITDAASQGETVLMMQTDDIHESFYDLFNQHFRKVGGGKGKRTHFFANVASGSHSKPCKVNPAFQCVVIVKESELAQTPAPFLNRFEKYQITTHDMLDSSKGFLPKILKQALTNANGMLLQFVEALNKESFCGYNENTIPSLFIHMLPKTRKPSKPLHPATESAGSNLEPAELLGVLISHLKQYGFNMLVNEQLTDEWNYITCSSKRDKQMDRYFKEILDIGLLEVGRIMSQLTSKDLESELDVDSVNKEGMQAILYILSHWMFIHVAKQLLQLMTPEAFILHKDLGNRKPSLAWFKDAYLKQNHFCLKSVLSESEKYASAKSTLIQKVICFTRSSQAVSCFPDSKEEDIGSEGFLLSEKMVVCKLSSVSSQQEFVERLTEFRNENCKEVMIIVANMHESTKKLINFVRLRIDEEEEKYKEAFIPKMYVLLLHFPPTVSQESCYPAIFLYGWDYHYLDSLVSSEESTVALNRWFDFAYQTENALKSLQLFESKAALIEEVLPVLVSRVKVKRRKDGWFNQHLTVDERKDNFRKLLQGPVGKQLFARYSKYWTAKNISVFLKGAAAYSRSHKSILSISDVVENLYENTLFNFLAYMIHHVNMYIDFDTLDEETEELFLKLLDKVPVPGTLRELQTYGNTWGVDSDSLLELPARGFPAFDVLCSIFDEVVSNYLNKPFNDISKKAVKELEKSRSPYLMPALESIEENPALWSRYLIDVMVVKFKLDRSGSTDTIAHSVMEHFTKGQKSLQEKILYLHSSASTNPLDLTKLQRILKPLVEIQGSSVDDKIPSLTRLITGGDSEKSQLEMCRFVIQNLYESLTLCDGDYVRMKDWYQVCSVVYFTPSLEAATYSVKLKDSEEGRLNTIKAIYFLLQCQMFPHTPDYCKKVWLFAIEIINKQTDKTCVRFPELFEAVRKEDLDLSKSVRTEYFQYLLQHFFHPMLKDFHPVNVQFFLQLINMDYEGYTLPLLKECLIRIMRTKETLVIDAFKGVDIGPHFCDTKAESKIPNVVQLYFLAFYECCHRQSEGTIDPLWTYIAKYESADKMSSSNPSAHLQIQREVYALLAIEEIAKKVISEKDYEEVLKPSRKDILTLLLCEDDHYQLHQLVLFSLIGDLNDEKMAVINKLKHSLSDAKFPYFDMDDIQEEISSSKVKRNMYPTFWTQESIKEVFSKWKKNHEQEIVVVKRCLSYHGKVQSGLKLLPISLKFCKTLKKSLDFKLDETAAKEYTIKQAITKASKEERMKLNKQFEKVKASLEEYRKYSPDSLPRCKEWEDLKLSFFLHIYKVIEGEKNMETILKQIAGYNEGILDAMYRCQGDLCIKWIPDKRKVPVVELSQADLESCKLRMALTEETLLSCLRQCLPVVGTEAPERCVEDMCVAVIRMFLTGVPIIKNTKQKFLQEFLTVKLLSTSKSSSQEIVGEENLLELHQQLKPMKEEHGGVQTDLKDVIVHFHSSPPQVLKAVIRGLSNIAHDLSSQQDILEWSASSILNFIQNTDKKISLSKIITLSSSTPGSVDFHVLESVPLRNLMDVLDLFVGWLKNGFYTFHTLPLGVKKEIPPKIADIIREKATREDVVQKYVTLEKMIPPEAMGLGFGDFETSAFEQCLVQFIKRNEVIKQRYYNILDLIPEEIQLQHYVHFVVLLRDLTKDRRVPKGDDEDFESLQEENTAEDSEEDEEEEEAEEEEWDPKSYIIDVGNEPKKNANEHDLDVNSTQFTEELKAEEPEALEAEDDPRPNENELEGATQVSHSSSNSEEEEEDDEGCFSKLPLHASVHDHLLTMEGQFQTPPLTSQNWAQANPVHSIDQTMDEANLTLEDIEDDEINDEHRIRKSNKVGVSAGSGADLLQERTPEIIPAQQIFSSANEEYSSTSAGDVPVSMPKMSELVSVSGERVTQSDIVLVDPEKTTDLDYKVPKSSEQDTLSSEVTSDSLVNQATYTSAGSAFNTDQSFQGYMGQMQSMNPFPPMSQPPHSWGQFQYPGYPQAEPGTMYQGYPGASLSTFGGRPPFSAQYPYGMPPGYGYQQPWQSQQPYYGGHMQSPLGHPFGPPTGPPTGHPPGPPTGHPPGPPTGHPPVPPTDHPPGPPTGPPTGHPPVPPTDHPPGPSTGPPTGHLPQEIPAVLTPDIPKSVPIPTTEVSPATKESKPEERKFSEKALNMTVEDTVEWLHSIKQGKYADIFQENEIDGDMLSDFTAEDLEELGVKLSASKIILNKFKRIQ